ncbi:MAG TPA: phosphoadenylyl-sulfate reductase [Saprospiraceae bacterium]|nr:phosphoadenylyl-sulfate reductase [Saprospiraceae bacterium]
MTTYLDGKRLARTEVGILNELFGPLTFEERLKQLYRYFPREAVLFTSSFGTKSVFLLHLLSRIQPEQTIHFIDTGFHFPETLAYKDDLTHAFGLRIVDVNPDANHHEVSRMEQLWSIDPSLCCAVNKLSPLEPLKARHKVWISGLMAYQTEFRSGLRVFEKKDGILKFYPLIDIDEGEFLFHMSFYQLPPHPLESKGYGSIGCEHCTAMGKGREGRWKGTGKTECGLHP